MILHFVAVGKPFSQDFCRFSPPYKKLPRDSAAFGDFLPIFMIRKVDLAAFVEYNLYNCVKEMAK